MLPFRAYLVIAVVTISAYTIIVGMNHGWNLVPTAISDLAAMDWRGQFDLDFLFLLSLAGIWIAWRTGFSPAGCALGLFIFAGGMPFLAIYLLIAIYRSNGDIRRTLLGQHSAVA